MFLYPFPLKLQCCVCSGTSIAKRKNVNQRHTRVPSLPTRKSARASNEDLEAISKDVNIATDMPASEDSPSTEEGEEGEATKFYGHEFPLKKIKVSITRLFSLLYITSNSTIVVVFFQRMRTTNSKRMRVAYVEKPLVAETNV